jgi:hypothetical protein
VLRQKIRQRSDFQIVIFKPVFFDITGGRFGQIEKPEQSWRPAPPPGNVKPADFMQETMQA